MSTSLLYHAQDMKGIHHSRTEFKEGRTVFHAVVSNGCCRCSKCGSRRVVQSGGVYREFKLVPTGTRKNLLRLYIPRLVCRECGAVRQVDLPFADRRKGYTRALARYVLSLCRLLPLKTVAELCGLSWNTVKEIHKAALRRKHRRSKFGGVRIIAIDEVCVGHPRKYLTLVIDLESGEVLHIARGKGAAALKGFWRRLARSGARIHAVCTDMASGYMAAVEEHLPEAKSILDHFHLVKYMNDKLTLLRCQLFRKAGDEGRRLLKGTRWLLLRSRAHLGSDALLDLDEALRCNEPLYIAYYLKEELASLWSLSSKAEAAEHLENWLVKAANSGVAMLEKISKWLGRVKDKILNWFDCHISSARLEAFNGQIRRLLKNTCGLRDQEYLFLRIRDLVDAKL